jgi:hypothetical protein
MTDNFLERFLSFYAGAAFVTFFAVKAPLWQRAWSALVWWTFPFWRGR